jgi:hypothetical protein
MSSLPKEQHHPSFKDARTEIHTMFLAKFLVSEPRRVFRWVTSHDPGGYSSSGPPDPFSFSSSCLPVAEHDSCTSTLKAKTASREGHQDIQASVAEETYDSTNTFHPWHGIQQVLTPPETSADKLPNKLLPLTSCQR